MSGTRTGGAVFKNRSKTTETHPDWRGDVVMPDGVKWSLAMWERTDRNGNPYYSVAVSEYRERPAPKQNVHPDIRDTDEIPF